MPVEMSQRSIRTDWPTRQNDTRIGLLVTLDDVDNADLERGTTGIQYNRSSGLERCGEGAVLPLLIPLRDLA